MIFVTVGTTRFDSLFRFLDEPVLCRKFTLFGQIGPGTYEPSNFPWYRFSESIEQDYLKASIIISHGGAGSLYRLLELNKKIIVVPNSDRVDDHQNDIANFLSKRGHVLLANNQNELVDLISYANSFFPVRFLKQDFFKAKEIIEYLS